MGQSSENGCSVLVKFVSNKHVLNLITTTYLINNHLQHVYENQFVFSQNCRKICRKISKKREF